MIRLSRDLIEVILLLSEIMDVEEDNKLYHAWRTGYVAKILAQEIIPEKTLDLFVAGLLHDIGTFDLTNHITHYQNVTFQVQEKEILSHPIVGADILGTFPGLTHLGKYILNHHERYDSFGYPFGLKGDDIPIEAQILRLADSLAFLCHASGEVNPELVRRYIQTETGKEFSKVLKKPSLTVFSSSEVCIPINDTHRLAAELSSIIEHSASRGDLEDDYSVDSILSFFGRMLDAKHRYTGDHSNRTSRYSVLIAMAMGFDPGRLEIIRRAGLLHDIGKLGVPLSILCKPGKLTEEEFGVIMSHASLGVKFVEKVSVLADVVPIVATDQEHFDGSGYPKGLKGDQIPIESRIILVADAFDAMTSERAYRKAMPVDEAIAQLESCAGSDFDPEVVKVAIRLFKVMPLKED